MFRWCFIGSGGGVCIDSGGDIIVIGSSVVVVESSESESYSWLFRGGMLSS